MGNKKDAGKGKRRGKGRVSVPDLANLEPRSLIDKQGSMCVAFHACMHAYGGKRHRYSHVSILTNKNQESPRMFFYTYVHDSYIAIGTFFISYSPNFRAVFPLFNRVIVMKS